MHPDQVYPFVVAEGHRVVAVAFVVVVGGVHCVDPIVVAAESNEVASAAVPYGFFSTRSSAKV